MLTSQQIIGVLQKLEISHVLTVPDSTIGPWLDDIAAASIKVVQVCREGEAWAVAAGLYLGGAQPLVLIQCTGLFESGDALRNVLHDYRLPLYAMIGYRSYLSQASLPGDTCLKFTEPILDAWQIDWKFFDRPEQASDIVEHARICRAANRAGIALIAEGKA
jgi:sulfopyruvate decarboxylase subunit alpha